MRISLSRAFDFAHLGGGSASTEETQEDLRLINGPSRARADKGDDDDDERKKKDGESDDDYAKRMKKLDEDEAANKGKKNGAAEDDDECDDEDDTKEEASVRVRKAEARGARLMQQRIGKILSSRGASRNMKLAAKLACNTMMSADEAIVIVEESPAAASRLGDRMLHSPQTRVPSGSGGDTSPDAKSQKGWEAAYAPYMPKS